METPAFGPPLFIDAAPAALEAIPAEWKPTRPICLAFDGDATKIGPWLDAGSTIASAQRCRKA